MGPHPCSSLGAVGATGRDVARLCFPCSKCFFSQNREQGSPQGSEASVSCPAQERTHMPEALRGTCSSSRPPPPPPPDHVLLKTPFSSPDPGDGEHQTCEDASPSASPGGGRPPCSRAWPEFASQSSATRSRGKSSCKTGARWACGVGQQTGRAVESPSSTPERASPGGGQQVLQSARCPTEGPVLRTPVSQPTMAAKLPQCPFSTDCFS